MKSTLIENIVQHGKIATLSTITDKVRKMIISLRCCCHFNGVNRRCLLTLNWTISTCTGTYLRWTILMKIWYWLASVVILDKQHDVKDWMEGESGRVRCTDAPTSDKRRIYKHKSSSVALSEEIVFTHSIRLRHDRIRANLTTLAYYGTNKTNSLMNFSVD